MHGTIRRSPNEIDFCPTIFHQPWWLDIATEGNWARVNHVEDKKLLGWLPYCKASRCGLSISRMPISTPMLGPAICPEGEHDFRAQMRIIRALLVQLPSFSCFAQKMHRGIQNVLPFQMEGFCTGVQTSFEISGDAESAWHRMRRRTREVILSAQKSLAIDHSLDVDTFFAFAGQNHLRKFGTPMKGSRTSKALVLAALERGCGSLVGARDLNGRLVAGIMCVFDHSTAYYFLCSRTRESGNGAISFLLWNAIQAALNRGLVFDFNGVADAGSASFFSGFTTCVSPRYTIKKTGLAFRLGREGRRLAKGPDNVFTDCL